MKKQTVLFLLVLFSVQFTIGQEVHKIILTSEAIDVVDRQFYIAAVVDNRTDKASIGTILKGTFDRNIPAEFQNGLKNSLTNYFRNSLPAKEMQIPIVLVVNKLRIFERKKGTTEFGYAELLVEFQYKQKHLFSDRQLIDVSGLNVTKFHERNIKKVLEKSLQEFNSSAWMKQVHLINIKTTDTISDNTSESGEENIYNDVELHKPEDDLAYSENTTAANSTPNESDIPKNRNTLTIGYQIGGYVLLGVDYEIRVHDYLGLHFGGGLLGYTAGLKIHTNPKKYSSFFNLSYKDSGFGLLTAAGVEYGSKWIFKKRRSDFGLVYQVGLVKILSIDDEYAEILFPDMETPGAMFSLGFGFSW